MRFLILLFFAVSIFAAEEPGARLYFTHCSQCHDVAAPGQRIPSKSALQKLPPETIYKALTSGVMKQQGAALSEQDRRTLARWLGASGVAVKPEQGENQCPANAKAAETDASSWTSWGNGLRNWRYQPASLKRSDVPHLKLKWAFGLPNVKDMRSQPAVYRGRVYVGASDGTVYSLDAASGCLYWESKVKPVRSGMVVQRVGSKDTVFFGDSAGEVNALDAATGKPLWRIKLDEHADTLETGTPTYADGRLYVPVSSYEELAAAAPGYSCCTFRGSVSALDAATGKMLWKTYTIAEQAKPRGKTTDGRTKLGPSGAPVWSSPTVDAAKGVLYVTTGDNYSDPPTDTSDALLALDLKTGKLLWSRQFTKGDTFNISCAVPGKQNCPASPGGDFDFGSSPILVPLSSGKRVLILGQKSGFLYGVDPDARGKLLWQAKTGRGGALGGIQWGPATDGKRVYVAVSDVALGAAGMDPKTGGGMLAYGVGDGKMLWKTPPPGCGDRRPCSPAQSQAVTAIPSAVFSGSLDGHLRAYDTGTGKIIWDFDTERAFQTVNHVTASGGSLDAGGPVVADGTLFVGSGYPQFGGTQGNVLLAFGKE